MKDQGFFSGVRVLLDGVFPAHGFRPVFLGFHIHQSHRSSLSGVFRADTAIMLFNAAGRVGCPPCVERAIRTFYDVTKETHRLIVFLSLPDTKQLAHEIPGGGEFRFFFYTPICFFPLILPGKSIVLGLA